MAKLVYALNVSLDGYVDHMAMGGPGPLLFRHFIEEVRNTAGSIYGRVMYEAMRYWDEDQADWTPELHEYAEVWRKQPKWVVSRTLKSVGPNAKLVADNVEAAVRVVKEQLDGQVEVAGTKLAGSLTDLGLIDEYLLYMRPFVLGDGTPYFIGARPPLRLAANELIGEDAVRLTYVPAN